MTECRPLAGPGNTSQALVGSTRRPYSIPLGTIAVPQTVLY